MYTEDDRNSKSTKKYQFNYDDYLGNEKGKTKSLSYNRIVIIVVIGIVLLLLVLLALFLLKEYYIKTL